MKKIRYISTNGRTQPVSFSEALLTGLAPDGGLYIPEKIPVAERRMIEAFSSMQYHEIASEIIGLYSGNEISAKDLQKLCKDAYNFDVPLEEAGLNKYILRLDQGPTASFKDFAARMMSRLMQHFLASGDRNLTILTATSGDTGGAVASAFHGLGNIQVIILFPTQEVTPVQRRQMTTLGENIKAIAVDGKFDDCQRIVKQAFSDTELSGAGLTSANSINIGRLVPQSVYYFYAWSRLDALAGKNVVFSVPSGNFGNLTAGIIAKKMGLPIQRFIAATNENDEVPEFLRSGIYKPVSPSRNCISSAMNVGHPSNLARMVALYGGMMDEKGVILRQPDMEKMKTDILGISISDKKTRESISEEYSKTSLMLEPHGAVAWEAVKEYGMEHPHETGKNYIILETAHPAKFSDDIRGILNIEPPVPHSIKELFNKEESCIQVKNDYISVKNIIKELNAGK